THEGAQFLRAVIQSIPVDVPELELLVVGAAWVERAEGVSVVVIEPPVKGLQHGIALAADVVAKADTRRNRVPGDDRRLRERSGLEHRLADQRGILDGGRQDVRNQRVAL